MTEYLGRTLGAVFGVRTSNKLIRRPRQSGKTKAALLAHPRLMHLDIEPTDGWFLTLQPGWKAAHDPMCPVHCFGATTLTEGLKAVRAALPCDCEQCQAEKAQ